MEELLIKLLETNQGDEIHWQNVPGSAWRYSAGHSFRVEYPYNSLLPFEPQKRKLIENSYLFLHLKINNTDRSAGVPVRCRYCVYRDEDSRTNNTLVGPPDTVLIPYDEDGVKLYVTLLRSSSTRNNILSGVGSSCR